MKKHYRQLAALAVTLFIGILIGVLGSRANRQISAAAADAAEPEAAKCETAKAECKEVQRFGSVIGVRRETLDEYVKIHAAVWPTVLEQIKKSNIRNYSIYLGELDDGNLYLFSYFEYTGDDFKADMARMGEDPNTQKWWKLTDPMQIPQKNRKKGDHWMTMEEVFHQD